MRKGHVAERAEGPIGKLNLEEISLDDDDVRSVSVPVSELRGEASVQFDGDDLASRLRQNVGESPGSGSNLDDQITRGRSSLADDLVDNWAATKKVLPARSLTDRL